MSLFHCVATHTVFFHLFTKPHFFPSCFCKHLVHFTHPLKALSLFSRLYSGVIFVCLSLFFCKSVCLSVVAQAQTCTEQATQLREFGLSNMPVISSLKYNMELTINHLVFF